MNDLTGKVALVTGAKGRQGIGRAIALRLAQDGADLVVNDLDEGLDGLRPQDVQAGWRGLPSLVAEVEALGRRALPIHADVSSAAAVDRMVEAALERYGRIDVLVCNAAAPPGQDRRPVLDLGVEAFDDVLRVNVKGVFLCARAVARSMVQRGEGGRIIVLSSCLGLQPRALYAAYSASKAAQIAFTKALALELAPHQITVNAICPGPVDTERFDRVGQLLAPALGTTPEAVRERILTSRAQEIPLGRIAQPIDIAHTAAFLASRDSAYLTGLALSATGGWVMP